MRGLSIPLDAIAPPRCIECDAAIGRAGTRALCARCRAELPLWRRADGCPHCGGLPRTDDGSGHAPVDFDGCPVCLAAGSALHRCHALLRYEGAVRRWIPGFKVARGPFGPSTPIRLAIEHLSVALAERVMCETAARPELVVGVPPHPRRLRQRGFDHTELIARAVARALGSPCVAGALARIRDTPPQATLVGRARRHNVRGAFRATRRLGGARQVWLVDDVLTTGSTLEAAGDALLDAGVLEVRALTLAATLPGTGAHPARRAYHLPPSFGR
jgi:ComF family protein